MITRIGAFSKSHNFVIQQMISNSHIHPFIRQDSPPSVYATLADRKLWSLARKRPSASGVKGATIGERDWTASRCISDAARSIDVRRCFLFFFPSISPHLLLFFFLSGNRVERVQFVRNTINADDDDATCERRIRTYICAGNPINRFKVGTFTGLKSILRRNSRNFSRFSLLPSSPFFIIAEISLLTSLRCYFVFQNFHFPPVHLAYTENSRRIRDRNTANFLNYFTIARAIESLVRYIFRFLSQRPFSSCPSFLFLKLLPLRLCTDRSVEISFSHVVSHVRMIVPL